MSICFDSNFSVHLEWREIKYVQKYDFMQMVNKFVFFFRTLFCKHTIQQYYFCHHWCPIEHLQKYMYVAISAEMNIKFSLNDKASEYPNSLIYARNTIHLIIEIPLNL